MLRHVAMFKWKEGVTDDAEGGGPGRARRAEAAGPERRRVHRRVRHRAQPEQLGHGAGRRLRGRRRTGELLRPPGHERRLGPRGLGHPEGDHRARPVPRSEAHGRHRHPQPRHAPAGSSTRSRGRRVAHARTPTSASSTSRSSRIPRRRTDRRDGRDGRGRPCASPSTPASSSTTSPAELTHGDRARVQRGAGGDDARPSRPLHRPRLGPAAGRPPAAIAEMEHAMGELGFQGITHRRPRRTGGRSTSRGSARSGARSSSWARWCSSTSASSTVVERRTERYGLPNTIGNLTERAITFGTLVFGGVMDRVPRPEALPRARRRLHGVRRSRGWTRGGSAGAMENMPEFEDARTFLEQAPSEYLSRF